MKLLSIIPVLFFAINFCNAQTQKNYRITTIAFYNCENFLDTIQRTFAVKNNPSFEEKVLSPEMYLDKLKKITQVISTIGTDVKPATPDGPAIIGLAEINSKWVLNDIIHHPSLAKRNYRYVHYDSKDSRGIDVALLFNPKYFNVDTSSALQVKIESNGKYYYSRDILWVKGNLNGETIYVYVNHWPSRLNGQEASDAARWKAALICRNHIDSILQKEAHAKIIVMGDFNDEPFNYSILNILKTTANPQKIKPTELFNPWFNIIKKGNGTLAYQDNWALFDQIILSNSWLPKNQPGFFYYQSQIFNREFITENLGKYKGYPMRTWDGNNYRGGYSDHFPVYITLLKKAD
jgi:hypothetical protein